MVCHFPSLAVPPVGLKTLERYLRVKKWRAFRCPKSTSQNLEIVTVDDENGVILVQGSVPGQRMGGY